MTTEQTTPLPELIAAQPILLGPFDRYWLSELVISLPIIGGEATAMALFQPYQQTAETINAPLPPVRLQVDNLFSAASTDPEIESAITAIGAAVLKLGVEQGLLLPPNAE